MLSCPSSCEPMRKCAAGRRIENSAKFSEPIEPCGSSITFTGPSATPIASSAGYRIAGSLMNGGTP